MEIKKYSNVDESLLFDLLVDEGDEWSDYHGVAGRDKYIKTNGSGLYGQGENNHLLLSI